MKNLVIALLAGSLIFAGCEKKPEFSYANPNWNNWINPIEAGSIGKFKVNEKEYKVGRQTTYMVGRKEYNLFTIIKDGKVYGLVPVNERIRKTGEITTNSGKIEDWKERVFEIASPEEPIEGIDIYPSFPKEEKNPNKEEIKKKAFNGAIKINNIEFLVTKPYETHWKDYKTGEDHCEIVDDTWNPMWDEKEKRKLVKIEEYLPFLFLKTQPLDETLDFENYVLLMHIEEFVAVRVDR